MNIIWVENINQQFYLSNRRSAPRWCILWDKNNTFGTILEDVQGFREPNSPFVLAPLAKLF